MKRKYIRDPLYEDFIILESPFLDVVEEPFFQRFRRIKQLGTASLVYPGADHSRFQHALGAFFLADRAVGNLRNKGISISDEEAAALKLAALVHDLGHGPLSHSLEHTLINLPHERLSYALIDYHVRHVVGDTLANRALAFLKGDTDRPFFHELLDGQLDVDRMDYLRRDSFFCGLTHGLVDIARILQTLTTVRERGQEVLAVEEKGATAVESYLMGRYLMYWAVYYHRTNLAAQALIEAMFRRLRDLRQEGTPPPLTPLFSQFLDVWDQYPGEPIHTDVLEIFVMLDDSDIDGSIKMWSQSDDPVLADLAWRYLRRKLPRTLENPSPSEVIRLSSALERQGLDPRYYLIEKRTAEVGYRYYTPDEGSPIRIHLRSGEVGEISQVLPTDTVKALSRPVVQTYVFSVAREVA